MQILNKLLSGRFIFTIVSAFVFGYLSIFGILPIDRVMEVLLIIIYAYFTKERKDETKW